MNKIDEEKLNKICAKSVDEFSEYCKNFFDQFNDKYQGKERNYIIGNVVFHCSVKLIGFLLMGSKDPKEKETIFNQMIEEALKLIEKTEMIMRFMGKENGCEHDKTTLQ